MFFIFGVKSLDLGGGLPHSPVDRTLYIHYVLSIGEWGSSPLSQVTSPQNEYILPVSGLSIVLGLILLV